MNFLKTSFPILGAAFLAACSATTPAAPILPDVPSVGAATGGTYTIVTNGTTHTMSGALTLVANNALVWYGALGGSTMRGSGYETADVLALSAMNIAAPNETFAGITGTLGTVPTDGTATYNALIRFQLLEPTEVHRYGLSGLTITADFEAATISGSAGHSTTVFGNIVGNEFTGTAASTGSQMGAPLITVPMQGGFYGTDGGTIAGAFAGEGMSGIFGGPVQPTP